MEEMEEFCQFPGHQNLVHSICWADDDRILITASTDSSVCIWNIEEPKFLQVRKFVYYLFRNFNCTFKFIKLIIVDQIMLNSYPQFMF